MDTLLAYLAEIQTGDDDDIAIRIESVANAGMGLELRLEVATVGFGVEESTRSFHIRCEELLEYSIKSRVATSLELTSDHPLLWQFTQDSTSAFFSGKPADAYAAVGALYEAHQNAVGDWFGLENYLNGSFIPRELLSGGYGLLAQGPVSLLAAYKDALRPHGIEVEIGKPSPPGGRMSSPDLQHRLRNESRALLIGDSWITGIGWTVQ